MSLGPTDVGPFRTYNCSSAELSELIVTSPYGVHAPPPGFLTVMLLSDIEKPPKCVTDKRPLMTLTKV